MIPPVALAMISGLFLLYLEGPTSRGLLMVVLLGPFFYLGAEILARRVTIDSVGITVSKLLRSVRLRWAEIESLDAIRSGSKVFLIIESGQARPILITNTISPFKEMVGCILERLPAEKVAPSAAELLSDPPSKHGPMIQAWVVFAILAGIAAGRMLGYG